MGSRTQTATTLEVVVSWGDRVIAVRHLRENERFELTRDADNTGDALCVESSEIPAHLNTWALCGVRDGRPWIELPPSASYVIEETLQRAPSEDAPSETALEIAGSQGERFELIQGVRVRVAIGGLTVTLRWVAAAAAPSRRRVDLAWTGTVLSTLMAFTAVLAGAERVHRTFEAPTLERDRSEEERTFRAMVERANEREPAVTDEGRPLSRSHISRAALQSYPLSGWRELRRRHDEAWNSLDPWAPVFYPQGAMRARDWLPNPSDSLALHSVLQSISDDGWRTIEQPEPLESPNTWTRGVGQASAPIEFIQTVFALAGLPNNDGASGVRLTSLAVAMLTRSGNAVSAAITGQLSAFQRCQSSASVERPAGRLVFRFVIRRDGTMGGVSTMMNAVADPALRVCAIRALHGVRFARAHDETHAEIGLDFARRTIAERAQ